MSPTKILLPGPMEIASTSRGVPTPESATRATVSPVEPSTAYRYGPVSWSLCVQ